MSYARRGFGAADVMVFEDKIDLMKSAALPLFKALKENKRPVFGFSTGATFEPFYRYVAENYLKEGCTFKRALSFNLDEYVGLRPTDVDSYHHYMKKNLFSKIDIQSGNTFLPNGTARSPDSEAVRYEKLIEASGGIEIQYLGVGVNGHIGFNEPGTRFTAKTHVARLARSTKEVNSAHLNGPWVPEMAITMGISTILSARRIILIATGESKCKIIKSIADSGVTARIPATALKRHRNVTIMLDSAAAGAL